MTVSMKSKRRTAPAKKMAAKSHAKKAIDFAEEYKKYFVAPTSTPDSFRILDLTDGAGISYSSHT